MKKIVVFAYTKGMGSGHLTRINAMYKGFLRANIKCDFYACVYRSKYKDLLLSDIKMINKNDFPPEIDIFICDWRADDYIKKLSKSLSKIWIGIRRLGTIKSTFPKHFFVVSIEPGVKGDVCIWPIISTWEDELVNRNKLNKILKISSKTKVVLLCENGAYEKHVDQVFNQKVHKGFKVFKCSNSEYSVKKRHISYYPVAQLFKAADCLILGAGYNSFHEALSYTDLKNVKFVNVGGDDQKIRINKINAWEKGRESQAHLLAKVLYARLLDNNKKYAAV